MFFFSSLEMVSYTYAHVLYGSSIVQCVAIIIFFCYSLNLCEMRSVRWWKFLDILHCWCTCVLSIAFWLGVKFSWCTTCNQEWLKLGEIIGDWFLLEVVY